LAALTGAPVSLQLRAVALLEGRVDGRVEGCVEGRVEDAEGVCTGRPDG